MSASDGERSPKRQRLESYSPASPPLNPDTKAFIPPNTPPPSVRMSPSWQAQSSQNHHQGNSSTFPTPPSTSGFHGHATGRGAGSDAGGDSGRQTPVTDAGGEVRKDSDGDMEMADRQDGGDGDAEHRRTNHERQRNADAASSSSLSVVQPLHKLSTTPIPQVLPHPSLDLIQLYSLQRIQASVARRDPRTGEKINKLRKSYENKVKALGLEGRNKATQNSNELQGLLDPGWNFEHEPGVTYWQAKVRDSNMQLGNKDAEDEIFSKLSAAFDLHPGRLPPKEHKEYQSMLGLDDPAAGVKPAMNKAPNGPVSAMAKTAPAAQIRNSAPASPGNMAGRPDRANKKRRYDDSSFVGYQEGYEDDGYSTGGMDDTGRRGSNAKRQKRKDFPSTSATAQQSARNSPSTFSNGTQNGMVGVRSS
ncbi:hypothetical protein M409DRAFT_18413 [Zasmidium cellare ATCC 36951]|uniref:Mediator of RNA polymerase II transcription subunit 19 n=1 Tax=Zasmidium cellare ATCC 36951 TaxID=1080233 RepID=A0A6A6CYN0_ZASCE|nr:uncharacterized protein M409DRAFT_18413 [Zasmidium cellare ATCC 36951]KAF2171300.1 hypothetical protein M409DRAFT_18413 [Zasmidium cellare ATCC 36951]